MGATGPPTRGSLRLRLWPFSYHSIRYDPRYVHDVTVAKEETEDGRVFVKGDREVQVGLERDPELKAVGGFMADGECVCVCEGGGETS